MGNTLKSTFAPKYIMNFALLTKYICSKLKINIFLQNLSMDIIIYNRNISIYFTIQLF